MKTINQTAFQKIRVLVLFLFILASFAAPARDVVIPDPNLSAAIRQALNKPAGPLTDQDLLGLTNLIACCRGISSAEGLEGASNLLTLDIENNLLTNLDFLSSLTQLRLLDLSDNQLTNSLFPAGLTNLTSLILEENPLSELILPAGMTSLVSLEAGLTQVTHFELPTDMHSLVVVDLEFDPITNLTIPSGLTSLNVLALQHNQLTNLTLPPDAQRVSLLLLEGNPLQSVVLPETLTSTRLTNEVASLRDAGISVFTYDPTLRISSPRVNGQGGFEFTLAGPPGAYDVFDSVDLVNWNELGRMTNTFGTLNFADLTAPLAPRKFYRVVRLP